jgi:hypothetical protein
MNDEDLLTEVEKHGKVMERQQPMSREEKYRAYMCFRFVAAKDNVSDDNKMMLQTAIRVLKLL